LAALRQHLDDQLVVREGRSMRLTDGGSRLYGIASQMVALGAEAETAVRAGKGSPAPLRLLVTSTVAEFIATPLLEAFGRRWAGAFNPSSGVATAAEMRALLPNRLADAALGPDLGGDPGLGLVSEPVLRYRIVVVRSPRLRPRGAPHQWQWLVDPSGADPDSDTGRVLRAHGVPEERVRVFPNQTAAWAAAADGAGVAPAIDSLVASYLRRGELCPVDGDVPPVRGSWSVTTLSADRRSDAALRLRNFLGTPVAMQLMCSPGTGVTPSRFRPPVYVTIWS
jgi:DNA-binding transcriptional LysR family regulator